jgi:hypothetical protein
VLGRELCTGKRPLRTAGPEPARGGSDDPQGSTQIDPIEQEIEVALNPGAFIPDRACFPFVSDLDEVAAKIAKLIASDPARAVNLYEAFLAACYLKLEELDDSSGSFGQFVDELYCGWVKARQPRALTLTRRRRVCSSGWTRTSTASATTSRRTW